MQTKPNGKLALTRKIGERVLIGQDITIEVVRASSGKVMLAFQAPKEVRILREEILTKGVCS